MTDIFWYFNKTINFDHFQKFPEKISLPIPWSSISEIHWIGDQSPISSSIKPKNIKYWQKSDSIFDLEILLLNRLKAREMESMLIVETFAETLFLALFGSGTIVGKYNLPPEAEILNSGWVDEKIFEKWLDNPEKPNQILISENNSSLTNSFPSLISAIPQCKKTTNNNLPFLFHSIGSDITYLVLEKI